MKRIYFLVFAILLFGTASITAQSREANKNTIKRANEIAKTGKVSSPPGSSNLTKYLEKKAKESKANAEMKKNSENKTNSKEEKANNTSKK